MYRKHQTITSILVDLSVNSCATQIREHSVIYGIYKTVILDDDCLICITIISFGVMNEMSLKLTPGMFWH